MKVKITKCSAGTWWYASKIGEVYDVLKHTNHTNAFWSGSYELLDKSGCMIHKDDCEVVETNFPDDSNYTFTETHPLSVEPEQEADVSIADAVVALQSLLSECYEDTCQIVIESDCMAVNAFGKTFVCYKGEELEEITKAVAVLAGAVSEP